MTAAKTDSNINKWSLPQLYSLLSYAHLKKLDWETIFHVVRYEYSQMLNRLCKIWCSYLRNIWNDARVSVEWKPCTFMLHNIVWKTYAYFLIFLAYVNRYDVLFWVTNCEVKIFVNLVTKLIK